MRILFYYPSNKRTISIESLIRELIKKGHQITLLTLCEKGDLHTELEQIGVKTFTHVISKNNSLLYHFNQAAYLVHFCRDNNIQSIFSHLQQANIIAVFAQYFTKAKVIIFRHHDYARNKKESRADKIINRLASLIVVPSSGVQRLMLKNERVQPKKIKIIPYIYDFGEYKKPDQAQVATIRKHYNCHLLLIMVSRLVPQKRHHLTFTVIHKLVKEGYNIKLLVMDTGTETEMLETFIRDNHLENNIFLLGYKTNVIDYIGAADVLVHPSISEASCSAVKEAGLLEKRVIVCKGVGDFDEYIVDGENGYVLDRDQTEEQLTMILKKIFNEKKSFSILGSKLKESVMANFSASQHVIHMYEQLIENR